MLKALSYILSILVVGTVLYAAPAIDTQRFKPSIGVSGMVVTDTSKFLNPFTFGGMLYLHYDKEPFVQTVNSKETKVVENVFQSDLVLAFGLPFNFEIGAVIPFTMYTSGTNTFSTNSTDLNSTTLGDIQFALRYRVPTFSKHVGMGLSFKASIPTGDVESFNTADTVVYTPGVFIDFKVADLLLAFNFAYVIKDEVNVSDLELKDEVSFSVGLMYAFTRDFELSGELFGSFQTANPFKRKEETPAEFLLSANYYVLSDLKLTAGAGLGVSPGVGTPSMRVLVGIGYVPRDIDTDKDGLFDRIDKCPTKPEDKDGFEDVDGCPDPDNDQDGILDTMDKCKNEPEDKDEFEDVDGCPDPDNDQDGILDADDKCKNDPEDKDGFEDEDGCPDLDNDQDGILDANDKCMNEPEDKDGFEDEEGCPDPDNDQDGILDTADKCPNSPEDKDGFKDEDGCPELDNDEDGIIDTLDKCPLEPETYNGVTDEDGCPDKGVELVKINLTTQKIEIKQKVFFDFDSAKISKKSFKLLLTVATIINNDKTIKVRIEGHTDDQGKAAYNEKLSKDRAKAVMDYLIKEGKIDASRLTSDGYGSKKPLLSIDELTKKVNDKKLSSKERAAAKKELKAARDENRRVDFVIVEE